MVFRAINRFGLITRFRLKICAKLARDDEVFVREIRQTKKKHTHTHHVNARQLLRNAPTATFTILHQTFRICVFMYLAEMHESNE